MHHPAFGTGPPTCGTLLVVPSLVLPYLMVFYAEFGGRDRRVARDGATQGPITETLLAYAVAFIVSAAMLAMFGRVDAVNGAATARVVTLAFPASIGSFWRSYHEDMRQGLVHYRALFEELLGADSETDRGEVR